MCTLQKTLQVMEEDGAISKNNTVEPGFEEGPLSIINLQLEWLEITFCKAPDYENRSIDLLPLSNANMSLLRIYYFKLL